MIRNSVAQCFLGLAILCLAGCAGVPEPKVRLCDGGKAIAIGSLRNVLENLNDLAGEEGDPIAVALTHIDLARAWTRLGSSEQAAASLKRANAAIGRIGNPAGRYWPLKELAVGYAEAGDYSQARTVAAGNPSTKQRFWGLGAIGRVQARQNVPAVEICRTLKLIKDAAQRKWATADIVKTLGACGRPDVSRELIKLMAKSPDERDWLLKESAIALASGGYCAAADSVLGEIRDKDQIRWVSRALVGAHAAKGDARRAIELALQTVSAKDRPWACWDAVKALPAWVSADDFNASMRAMVGQAEKVTDLDQRQTLLEYAARLYADRGLTDKAKVLANAIESRARADRPRDLLRAIRVYCLVGDTASAERALNQLNDRTLRGRARRERGGLVLVDAYVAMGRFQDAQRLIAPRTLHPSSHASAWAAVFTGLVRQGRCDEALGLVAHVKSHSQHSSIVRPLAQVFAGKGKTAAVDKLAPMLDRKDRDDVYRALIAALAEDGRMLEAVSRLDRVVDSAAKSEAMAAIALSHWVAGERSKPMQLLAYMPNQDQRIETAGKIFQRLAESDIRAAGRWPANAATIALRLEMLRGCAQAIAHAKPEANE